MAYAYAGRNLFDEPEHYSYAAADDAGFLQSWIESRSEFQRSLASAAAQLVPSPPTPEKSFALADTLCNAAGKSDEAALIEPFVKKYEVFKRLFSFYEQDGRRTPNSPPAPLSTYVDFAEALLRVSRAGRLKNLSVLLKLTDALCSVSASNYSATDARRLSAVLDGERHLVRELERGL